MTQGRFRILELVGGRWLFQGSAHRIEWALDCIHQDVFPHQIKDTATGLLYAVRREAGINVAEIAHDDLGLVA